MANSINKDADYDKRVLDYDFVQLFWKGGRDLVEGCDQEGDEIIIPQVQDTEVDGKSETQDFMAKKSIISSDGTFNKGIIGFEGFIKNSGVSRENVGQPDNTSSFWDDAREFALWMGKAFVGIDAPSTTESNVTVAQQETEGLTPQWILIDPRQVPFTDWNLDGTLKQILIKEVKVRKVAFGDQPKSEENFILWTDTGYERFKADGDGNFKEIGSGVHTFGAVPFRMIESVFDTVAICTKIRQCMNREKTNLSNHFRTGNILTVFEGLMAHEDAKMSIHGNLLSLLGEHAKAKQLGVDAETMQENRADFLECKRDVRRSLFLPNEESLVQSGNSKREDKATLYAMLTKWSSQIEDIENWLGKLGWEGYSVEYPSTASDFVVESEEELLDMIERSTNVSMNREYISGLKKKLATTQNKVKADQVKFDKVPNITKEKAETIQILSDVLSAEVIAEQLGLDPGAVEKALKASSDRQISILNGIDSGAASTEDEDEDDDNGSID